MSYLSPSTEPTDRACSKCKHFGRWVGPPGMHVWCLDGEYVNATPYNGCAYFRAWAMMPANAVEPETETEKGPPTG